MGKGKKVRGNYEKTKHSNVKYFLHILGEAEIHTVPKTQNMGIVKLLKSTAKIMGKHKYSKGFDFLYIPHYSILLKIETHTIPKTWQVTEFS